MPTNIYLCSPKKFEGVISLPMITFQMIAQSLDLEEFDTLLFSSKQAVFFTDKLNPKWKEKFIIAVGPATKEKALELGATNIYYPKEFYGEKLAQDIIEKFKNKKILYPRPNVISFDHKSFLEQYNIAIEEKIIYKTTCKEYQNTKLKPNSIIIFTSPSTIQCFFKNFKWDKSFQAIVIGKTTLKNIPKEVEKVFIAKEPTIKACVEKAKEVAKSLN
jgi:uroporphyrinogen-III synthase